LRAAKDNAGMALRIRLALFRLLLVVAAYAIELAVFWRYPMPDRLFAIIPGTLLGLLLVLIKKDQIVGVLRVAGFTIIGMMVAILFIPDVGNGRDAPRHEIMVLAAGAAVGGFLGMFYRALRREAELRSQPEMNAKQRK
jgi:hypothetical protein